MASVVECFFFSFPRVYLPRDGFPMRGPAHEGGHNRSSLWYNVPYLGHPHEVMYRCLEDLRGL